MTKREAERKRARCLLLVGRSMLTGYAMRINGLHDRSDQMYRWAARWRLEAERYAAVARSLRGDASQSQASSVE